MRMTVYDKNTAAAHAGSFFSRQRINDLLASAVDYPLVTVTAGAGWDKTQTASAFLNGSSIPYVWVRLSKLDNLTTRFWESFMGALAALEAELPLRLSCDSFPYSIALLDNFLRKLACAIKGMDRFVMVFDDFHVLNEELVKNFIENLVSAGLENLSVMLIGREKPRFVIQGLFTGNIAFRVTQNDLRFTLDETSAYFKSQGISLTGGMLDEIYSLTEGWALALRLAVIHLKKHRRSVKQAISASKFHIFDLLEQEVFDAYSPQRQKLLIMLSLFDSIPADFLGQLPPDCLGLLGDMEKKNMFVSFEPEHNAYRFHQLFREFLSGKRACLAGEETDAAYYSAARWHHESGFLIDALMYYQKCARHEEIWDIISRYDIALPSEVANLFLGMIDAFPGGFHLSHPLVPVVRARLLLNNGKIKESGRAFSDIISKYEALPISSQYKAAAGEAYIFMGLISMLSYDYRFVQFFKKADACLPDGSALIDGRLSFSDGNFMVLINDPSPGELDKFIMAVMEAMPYGSRAMCGAANGVEYVTKAEAAYCVCDMKEAESSAYRAVFACERTRQYDTLCAAYFILTRVYINAGNLSKAEECIETVIRKIEDAGPGNEPYIKNCVYTRDAMLGWYHSRIGDRQKVPVWITKNTTRSNSLSPNNVCRDQFIRAYCLLTDEKYHELLALAETLDGFYEGNGLLLARIEAKIYKAIAAHRLENYQLASSALNAAYELAHANSLIMPFIEMGKYMRALVYAVSRLDDCLIPGEWLNNIYTKSNTYAKNLSTIQAQYKKASGVGANKRHGLTNREMDILKRLCAGLTRKEIASSFFISEGTVKQLVTGIYGKLGAHNRADAVRIAMQMGLDK